MSLLELIGAMFIRSQVIEQIMREMLTANQAYNIPSNFDRKTFGGLLKDFAKVYPDIKDSEHTGWSDQSLYAYLKTAKYIRDEAAHGYFLSSMAYHQLLHDYGQNADTDRVLHKSLRKSLWMLDEVTIRLIEYSSRENQATS